MTAYLTLLAALLPGLLLMRYFIKKDRFPEPTHLLVKTALLGLLITAPVIVLELFLTVAISGLQNTWLMPVLTAFLVAGFSEELFKLLVLHRYCGRKPDFDEPMDAVVYGVVASLGFACMENVLYVMQGGVYVAGIRALTAVPAHASLGALMGYYYAQQHFGLAGRARLGRARFWSKALWVPVLAHGLYDLFPMMFAYKASSGGVSMTWALALLIPFLLVLFWLVRRARAIALEFRAGQF